MTDINFVVTDSKQIADNLINQFQQSAGEVFYPGDERRQFLLNEVPVIVALYNAINDSGKQNLLRYARGSLLDALGERTNTPRLQAQKARTTFRFTLSGARPEDTYISAGKRGGPDSSLYFISTQDIVIPAGEITGDSLAEAVEAGAEYNGFAPGQINKLVDPIPYVVSVANIDTSAGGADVEQDDDGINIWSGYRERIRQSPAKMSTAGPEDAYIYWAKSANQNISDVSATSPSPGQVKLTVLMKGGELPEQGVLDRVLEICSDKKVRPLTDQVLATAPGKIGYNIELTYYISRERAAEVNSIRDAIETPGGIVDQYIAWQSGKLGRAVNPDSLKNPILNQGAFRVDITSPVYTEIENDEIAAADTITLVYGGVI